MYIEILLIASLVGIVYLDCGCNLLERFDEELEADQVQKRAARKYYRDGDEYKSNDEMEAEEVEMSFIPGGEFHIGTNEPHFTEDKESPERSVIVADFYIDKYEVSNAKFQEFVKSTGYTTEAESFGDSFIFKMLLTEEQQVAHVDFRVANAVWWYKVKGVSWQHPNGPNSNLTGFC